MLRTAAMWNVLLSSPAVAPTGLSYHFLYRLPAVRVATSRRDKKHKSVKDDEDMRERKRRVWKVFKKLHSLHSR